VVEGVQLDGLYAGNDGAAKQVVADLLDGPGFPPLDCGGVPRPPRPWS
jgi:predicted dinucleotide-binding enzyme